jgi:RNA recognition motif-containing protein
MTEGTPPPRAPADAARAPAAEPGRKIYLGNLSYDVTEERLREGFSRFGAIQSINIPHNPHGRSRGYAFIEFAESAEAERAIAEMAEQIYEGRKISVAVSTSGAWPSEGRRRDDRPRERDRERAYDRERERERAYDRERDRERYRDYDRDREPYRRDYDDRTRDRRDYDRRDYDRRDYDDRRGYR